MNELKDKVEAILFAVGKKIEIDDIAKLCSTTHIDDIKSALLELKSDYDLRNSPLMVFEEGSSWKLSVREKHLPLVQSLVAETELTKSLMETLAVIAWKYPILQSEVIHIRTNKAYDHLDQLEEMGFISRSNYGRTRQIKLTDKFFTYFDLPNPEQAQQAFRKILPDEIKDKIIKMENEINETEKAIEEAKRKKEEADSEDKNNDNQSESNDDNTQNNVDDDNIGDNNEDNIDEGIDDGSQLSNDYVNSNEDDDSDNTLTESDTVPNNPSKKTKEQLEHEREAFEDIGKELEEEYEKKHSSGIEILDFNENEDSDSNDTPSDKTIEESTKEDDDDETKKDKKKNSKDKDSNSDENDDDYSGDDNSSPSDSGINPVLEENNS